MAGGYTWKGASGGSWTVAANWVDSLGNPATQAPGSTDLAQFVGFSGTVTGAVGAEILDVGPGSALTLDGSGFFSSITVGQDLAGNVGDASLTIAATQVVSATMLTLGGSLGGAGTLSAAGTFSTTGGIIMDPVGQPCKIVVANGGAVYDGVSLTMAAGGLLQIGASGRMVLGDSSGGGTAGALTIDSGKLFEGEGTIAANVIDNGILETFNAGWPAKTLTVTGTVTGAGAVSVVQELDLNGAVGAGVTFTLASNGGSNAGLLRIAKPLSFAGVLATMSTHSVIALTGLSFDQAVWTTGELTVSGASGILILKTSGDHSFQSFVAQPDAISGTDIIVEQGSPAPTIFDPADIGGYVDAARDTAGQTLGGTALPGSAVKVYLNGAATPAYTATANASGVWSVTIGHLADGGYSLVAAVGGASSAPLKFVVDTAAPAAPVIASAAYANSVWSLTGTAAAGSTIVIRDGATRLAGTAIALSGGGWTFKTSENSSAVRTYTAIAVDPAGNASAASRAFVVGTAGNDVFAYASAAALAAPAAIVGDGGTDTIRITVAATLIDAAFAHVHAIRNLQLTGASSVTLGAAAAAAGIANVVAGNGSTKIADGNSGPLLVNAVALAAGASLTLSGAASFTVGARSRTLNAGAVTGALRVTTGAVGALTITTGSGANVIDAKAMTAGQTLALIGGAKASVSFGGDLSAAAYLGNLAASATALGPQAITTGAGADVILAPFGADTIKGGGGGDRITVTGHKSVDHFLYTVAADSLNQPARFDIVAGFADAGNGTGFNDVIDLAAIASVTKNQGALTNTAATVAAGSVAWIYNPIGNDTMIYANAGAAAVSQTSGALVAIELAGGNFKLAAGNFHIA